MLIVDVFSAGQHLQEYQLTLADLAVAYVASDVAQTPAFNVLASFRTPAAPAALACAEVVGSAVTVVIALADGSLSRLRMQVPTIPGSHPESVQLREEDFEEDALATWMQCHNGPATAIGIETGSGSGTVLSAGADGRICLTRMDAESPDAPITFYDSHAAITFTQAQWASPNTCVTTSQQGVVHAWDLRSGAAGPTHSLSLDSGQRHPLLSLCVNPAQPHTLACGSSNGEVALWDLRNTGHCSARLQADSLSGAVTGLTYDTGGGGGRLLVSTSKGLIGAVAGDRVVELYREPGASVDGMCVTSAGAASELFATTDQEVLVFMANAAAM